MSYSKLVKQWKKESKQRRKQEEKINKKMQELDEKINNNMVLSIITEDITRRQEQEQRIKEKDSIILEIRSNNHFIEYKEFLIYWDIMTENYYQIEGDLKKGKITINSIKKVVSWIEERSKNIVLPHWKEKFLTV